MCIVKSNKIITNAIALTKVDGHNRFLQLPLRKSVIFSSAVIEPFCNAEFYIQSVLALCNFMKDEELYLDINHRIW